MLTCGFACQLAMVTTAVQAATATTKATLIFR